MRKQRFAVLAAIVTAFCVSAVTANTICVYADASQVIVLADGSSFDPVYYADNNPDVVAALGTDQKALADHYLKYGKAEGRLAYAGATDLCRERILTLINNERKAAGAGSVVADENLRQIAQIRSDEMAEKSVFSHTRPNGTSWKTAFQKPDGKWKFSFTKAAENLARVKNGNNTSVVIDAWKASASHKKAMLSGLYTRVGIGISQGSDGRIYIATEFSD